MNLIRFAASVWLISLLLLASPGNSVCWPFINGQHLHIGWHPADETTTASLMVITHAQGVAPAFTTSLSLNSGRTFDLSLANDTLPPPSLSFWLGLVACLSWLLATPNLLPPRFAAPACDPPPRAA